MKGFTLIETIIYMTISSLITISFVSFAFVLTDTQAKIKENIKIENDGIYVLRHIENLIRKKETVDFSKLPEDIEISEPKISKQSDLTEINFKIKNKIFSISIYEK